MGGFFIYICIEEVVGWREESRWTGDWSVRIDRQGPTPSSVSMVAVCQEQTNVLRSPSLDDFYRFL